MKRIVLTLLVLLIVFTAFGWSSDLFSRVRNEAKQSRGENEQVKENEGGPEKTVHPLSIQALRNGEYPGSDIVVEQVLTPGSNYERYIVSYKSEGLKIYALMTIPRDVPGQSKPANGWPVVIFNHGYIPPEQYVTTERYIAYTDAFSRNGYIVFRSDYRGHGNSEGTPNSYGTNGYTIDVLNAIASVKKLGVSVKGEGGRFVNDVTLNALPFPLIDEGRIGMWGHSMGGHITLRSMVVSKDIKAGVIWGGVVASYPDLLNNWRRGTTPRPTMPGRRGWRQELTEQYGSPEKNPEFWNSISATSYLEDIAGPVQLHHGTADASVPYEFSEKLSEQLKSKKKTEELFLYPGDDHDITTSFGTAMQRSVAFFDTYLK